MSEVVHRRQMKGAVSLMAVRLLFGGANDVYGQVPVAATATKLAVTNSGEVGTSSLDMVATVLAGSKPVTGGRVTFFLNGQPLRSIQVVGSNPAENYRTGTAELRVRVPGGNYSVSATYAGSSYWTSSAAPNQPVQVPALAESSLNLMSTQSGEVYSYGIVARDKIFGLTGSVSLTDIAANKTLSSLPFHPSSDATSMSQANLVLGYAPAALLATDLSGNGTEDIVVAGTLPNQIGLYMQQADGSRKLTQSIPVGDRPIAVLADDFNADGLVDLAVLNSGDSTVSIILQDPLHPGLFLADPSPIHVGTMPVAMALGDFNRDGLPDLVVANFGDNTLSVLVNQDGLPGKLSALSPINTGNGPSAIAAASLMGGQQTDLAITNYYDGTVSIYPGNPMGLTLFSTMRSVNHVGAGPASVVAADLNGDGLIDLAVCNSLDGTVSVLLASASNPGLFPTQWLQDGFGQPAAVTIQSGVASGTAPNLVVADGLTGNLTLLHNDGVGRFPTETVLTLGPSLSAVDSMYSDASGAYGLVVMDASLNDIHVIDNLWRTTGIFPQFGSLDANVAHQLQAGLTTSGSISPIVSNIISVPAIPKSSQSISFERVPPMMYGAGPLSLAATSTSGLPVSFSVTSGAGKINGNVLTALSAGILVIEADQKGDAKFDSATAVSQSIAVQKALLTINPDSAVRTFGASNPTFTGHVAGLVGGDTVNVLYSSASDGSTPTGVYDTFPLGIGGRILDSGLETNYYIQSNIGTLTICPSASEDVASDPRSTTSRARRAPTPVSSSNCPTAPASGFPPPVLPTSRPGPHPLPVAPAPVRPQPPAPIPFPVVPIPSPPIVTTSPTTATPTAPGSGATPPTGVTPQPPPVVTPPPAGTPNAPGSGTTPPSEGNPSSPPIVIIPPTINAPVSAPSPTVPSRPPVSVGLPGVHVGALPIPIPIPIPIVKRTTRPQNQMTAESISLLLDRRLPPIRGWVSLSVLLECPGLDRHGETVTIAAGDSIVADLSVVSGQRSRSWLKLDLDHGVPLTAYFAGNRSCISAISEPVRYEPSSIVMTQEAVNIYQSKELLDLMQVPTLDLVITHEFVGRTDDSEDDHDAPMDHPDDGP